MKNFLIVIISIAFFSSELFAASFDCRKASTKTEKWICSDKELGKLDEDMAELYKDVKRIYPGIVSEQKEWLKSIKLCENAACVKEKYQERNAELVNIVVRAERAQLNEGREELEKNTQSVPLTLPSSKEVALNSTATQKTDVVPVSRFYMSGGYWFMIYPENEVTNNQSCGSVAQNALSATFFRFSPSQRHFIIKMKGSAEDSRFSKKIAMEIFGDKGVLTLGVIEPIDVGSTVTGYSINNTENILRTFSEECIKCTKLMSSFKFKPAVYKWCFGEP